MLSAIAVAKTLRTLGLKGVWGCCPQPAFDLSAQAEGGFTPAPRPNRYGCGYTRHLLE
jgi:hypothetical protein